MPTILENNDRDLAYPSRSWAGDGLGIGIALVAAGVFAIMATYGEIFFDALAFLVVLAVVGVFASRTQSSRLRWLLAGLMTVFVGVNAVYAVPDLSHPESPRSFIATAVVVVAGMTTAVLAALLARGRQVPASRVWVGVAAFLVIASAGSLLAASAVEDAVAQPGDLVLVAEDLEYPERIVATVGTEALFVSNRDNFRHNFVIDNQISTVELPSNTDVRIPIEELPEGTYRYYCSIAGHENMQGQLIVE